MQELVEVTGMVLRAETIGEVDKRVVLLTKEKGKISCFAKGARRQGNRLMASTDPFCFGIFKLYPGRSAYSISEATIQNYFEGMREDFEKACYGMYFLEVMDYYTRENNDEKQMLRLLYQSVRTLLNPNVNPKLVRFVFEIKSIVLNGEFPGLDFGGKSTDDYHESTVYAISYIVQSTIEKLFSFNVSDEVLGELEEYSGMIMERLVDRRFKSLEMLSL